MKSPLRILTTFIAIICISSSLFATSAQPAASSKAWQLNEQAAVIIRNDATPAGIEQAISLLKQAIKQDNADAMFNLGVIYDFGYGVNANHKKAFKWYTKAAEKKHFKAAYNLGVMCFYAIGTKKDLKQSANWFKMAAKAPYQFAAFAQYNYAVMLATGTGVEKNTKKAAYYLRLAGRNGFQTANRDEHILSRRQNVDYR